MHYLLWSAESKSIRGSSVTYTHTKKQMQQLRPWLCNNEVRVELHGHSYKWKWHQEMTVDRDRSFLFSFFGFLVPVKRQTNSTKCITTSLILYPLAEFEKKKNSPQRKWPAARFRGRALLRHRRSGGYLSMLKFFGLKLPTFTIPKWLQQVRRSPILANRHSGHLADHSQECINTGFTFCKAFFSVLTKRFWETGA